MSAQMGQVFALNSEQLEQLVLQYIGQGFVVANRTADAVTMVKRKEFNIVWAVIGFVICLLPLLIYLIVYATQTDQVVVLRIGQAAVLGTPLPLGSTGMADPTVPISEDGRLWWHGTRWNDLQTSAPHGRGARTTADGGGTVRGGSRYPSMRPRCRTPSRLWGSELLTGSASKWWIHAVPDAQACRPYRDPYRIPHAL